MKVYVTFGQDHAHRVNEETLDCNCVASIEADTYDKGRGKAFEFFGDKFCMAYHESDFNSDNMRFFPRGIIPL